MKFKSDDKLSEVKKAIAFMPQIVKQEEQRIKDEKRFVQLTFGLLISSIILLQRNK